jgi:hypothetical protein
MVKNGKLLVYKDNPTTDSLMGELYSATRYLNRNYQKTGLEPYLKYPTEAEIQKQLSFAVVSEFAPETVVEATDPSPAKGTSNGNGNQKVKESAKKDSTVPDTVSAANQQTFENTNRNRILDKYERRQAIRQILSDDLEKYNIHSYDSDRAAATSTWFEIESQTPQNQIPAGNWTHYFRMEDLYINENNYETTVSSHSDLIKIKRNEGATSGNLGSNVTLNVNGEEIEIPIQNALGSDLKKGSGSEEFNTRKVPNDKLRFPFKKNGQEGILVIEKINYDGFEQSAANPNNYQIIRITGCIFMK